MNKCKVRWEVLVDSNKNVPICSCIRKEGHEGNHVSYPSGEELEQALQKKLIDKTNEHQDIHT